MTLRCIDIETTGTDPATDAIVEIASVDLQRDGTITNQRVTLVSPGIPVPPEASAVHHLIDADLAGAPRLEQVIERSREPTPTWPTTAPSSNRSWTGTLVATRSGSAPISARSGSGRTVLRMGTKRCATNSA